jgi:hypothetical protein
MIFRIIQEGLIMMTYLVVMEMIFNRILAWQ